MVTLDYDRDIIIFMYYIHTTHQANTWKQTKTEKKKQTEHKIIAKIYLCYTKKNWGK